MTTLTTVRPSVWIGCLACYNAGVLNVRRFPAEDTAAVTSDDLHRNPAGHDELWCFDHEGFPAGTDEMSPTTAVQWWVSCSMRSEQCRGLRCSPGWRPAATSQAAITCRARPTSRRDIAVAGSRSLTTLPSWLRISALLTDGLRRRSATSTGKHGFMTSSSTTLSRMPLIAVYSSFARSDCFPGKPHRLPGRTFFSVIGVHPQPHSNVLVYNGEHCSGRMLITICVMTF